MSLNCGNRAIDVTKQPHVDNRCNPKLLLSKFHASFASACQSFCSLLFPLLVNHWLLWYTIANRFSFVMHHHHSYKEPFVVMNVSSSMLLEGVHYASSVLHHWASYICVQEFMFQQWASDLCAHESRNGVCIKIPTNKPPIDKRKILPSFVLIAWNVVFWKILCATIMVVINQGLYKCSKSLSSNGVDCV